jgi:hypothetical protein
MLKRRAKIEEKYETKQFNDRHSLITKRIIYFKPHSKSFFHSDSFHANTPVASVACISSVYKLVPV